MPPMLGRIDAGSLPALRSPAGRRCIAVAIAVAGLLGGHATAAQAQTYHQYLCRTPAGAPVPLQNVRLDGGPYADTGDTCRTGGHVLLYLHPNVGHPSGVESKATYSAPPGIELTSIALWRWMSVDRGTDFGTPIVYISSPLDQLNAANVLETCTQGCGGRGDLGNPFASENLVAKRDLPRGTQSFWIHARCDGGGTCPAAPGPDKATFRLFAGDVLLRDSEGPKPGSVGGSLTAPGPQRKTKNLLFSVTDAGSGVYSGTVLIGGRTVYSGVLDDNGGLCRSQPRSDGARAFLHGAPCKPQVNASVDIDTTRVPDGVQELRIVVDDAAGNSTTLFTGEITIDNGPIGGGAAGGIRGNVNPIGDRDRHVPNGTSATESVRLTAGFRRCTGRRRARRCFTRRRTTVSRRTRRRIIGRLRNETGVGIGGARLLVAERVPGREWQVVDGVTTDANGRYEWRQPGGPSRRVELIYWAFSDSTTFSLSNAIARDSRPRVGLRVTPRRPSRRGVIRFRGAVSRDVLPPEGVTVVLQAWSRDRPRWTTFRTVRTNARGHFRASYRFRTARRGQRFTFRAVAPRQAGYPFTRGVSRRSAATRVRLR